MYVHDLSLCKTSFVSQQRLISRLDATKREQQVSTVHHVRIFDSW
jgi:hypothetical protein